MKFINKCLALTLISLSLQGCLGAAATGAGLVYDHYRVERSAQDRYLSMKIESAIYGTPDLYEHSNLTIASFDNMVLIAGQTSSEAYLTQLTQVTSTIHDIKHLYNFVTVDEPISTSTSLHDTWITAKIKAQILTMREVDAGNIKVVTENSNVYLLGLVSSRQGDIITDISRKTSGVNRVITMFEYMHTTLSPVEKSI